ncbi:MAG: tyrosine-protein phosphatase [Bacteroidales bacterium]|nr:tyrosine-protein phosphatase [Candidatus Colimorpha onthohippi]
MSDTSLIPPCQSSTEMNLNDYLLALEMVPNARDLGGIRTQDGRVVKKGKLIRSGMLAHASEADIIYLRDTLHINTVIDLRTAYEVSKSPDQFVPGVRSISMPVQDKKNNLWVAMSKLPGSEPERLRAFARTDLGKEMTRKMYKGFVTDEFCQLQFAAFLELLATRHSERPILWHCSQGKDRTGLTAALLLFALGCDRATVVNEFRLTNVYYQDAIDFAVAKLREEGGTDEDVSVIEAIMGVRVDYFEDALDLIDSEYGSMERYLREVLVLTEEDIVSLRSMYLV